MPAPPSPSAAQPSPSQGTTSTPATPPATPPASAAPPASATPSAQGADSPVATAEQQARAEFERGQRQYDLARFDRAITHYARAYELLPLPAFLFNIAQCHRQLGEYRKAAFFYRRYLDMAESPPNAELARTLLKEVEAQAPPGPVSSRTNTEEPGASTPLHKRRWVWVTAAGVVAAGVAAGAVYATQPARPTLGTVNGR